MSRRPGLRTEATELLLDHGAEEPQRLRPLGGIDHRDRLLAELAGSLFVTEKLAGDGVGIFADEIAERLQVHGSTITRWIESGLIPPPIRLGRRLRWRRTTLEQFLRELGETAHAS